MNSINTRPCEQKDYDRWIGQPCIYIDPVGTRIPALITQIWGIATDPDRPASVNLVYVSVDQDKTDPYGRQLERKTSVVHEDAQYAHGMKYALA